MKRRGDWQQQGALGALRLEQLTGFVDCGFAAGNHGLGRVIEVGSLHHLSAAFTKATADLGTARHHRSRRHAQNGGHGTRAHGHGVLHGLGPKAHQRRGLGQRQHARCHQGRILTQGVASQSRRGQACFGHPHAVGGDTGHQHHGLGVAGQAQGFFGAVVNQLAQVFTQGVRGFSQSLLDDGVFAPGVQHAHGLRALTRKNNGKCVSHGVVFVKKSAAARRCF